MIEYALKKDPVSKRMVICLPDSAGNFYSIMEIAQMIGRSDSWVRRVCKKNGLSTVEDIEAFLNKKPTSKYANVLTFTVHKPLRFDRKSVCYRNKLIDKCIHYSSCQEVRSIESKHHPRYKEDGSCYTAPYGKSVQWTI